MKILYFSDSTYPLAALAGAIHTGSLPIGKKPGGSFWRLPFLNFKENGEGQDNGAGKILSLGKDSQGNDVYALSVKGERGMIYRLVESFLGMYEIKESELSLIDSGVRDNLYLLAGSFFCRSNYLAPLGRYLTSIGVKKHYGRLSQLVSEITTGLGKSSLTTQEKL